MRYGGLFGSDAMSCPVNFPCVLVAADRRKARSCNAVCVTGGIREARNVRVPVGKLVVSLFKSGWLNLSAQNFSHRRDMSHLAENCYYSTGFSRFSWSCTGSGSSFPFIVFRSQFSTVTVGAVG